MENARCPVRAHMGRPAFVFKTVSCHELNENLGIHLMIPYLYFPGRDDYRSEKSRNGAKDHDSLTRRKVKKLLKMANFKPV
ncbi:hypothetical protein CRP01_34630 [Flavilitoribacter nigricans DSM 23189 = NBRC 102662]|uniref:Uncharacterized protein n=1 Tax=Flavilitoribacter nigricans (strain ATCC 23147 / DSM 23189 / NBRC 102662 / NCIMB 1420 / SS-2) TaxID=1122177 RepID=A0A2D0N0G9_FLAN2|nr:hypothetical protein CRP01_34630 [Flavilitoribacter nigricans DSM 23189 = NBRC 102662]